MRPDPQVQVFPKLLQFYQDLSGRAEILQILREFGQQVKIPSVPRGEDLLGNCWETGLGTSAPHIPISTISFYHSGDVSRAVSVFTWGTFLPPKCKVPTDQAGLYFQG